MINAISRDEMGRFFPSITKVICTTIAKFKSCGLDPDTGKIEIRHTNKGCTRIGEGQLKQILEENLIYKEEYGLFFERITKNFTDNPYINWSKIGFSQKTKISNNKSEEYEQRQKEVEKTRKRIEKVKTAIHGKYDPIEILPIKGDEFSVIKDNKEYCIVCHVHFSKTRSGWIRKLESLDPMCFSIKFALNDLPEEVKTIWSEPRQQLFRMMTGEKYQINSAIKKANNLRSPKYVIGKFIDEEHLELEETNGAIMKLTDHGFIFDRESSGLAYKEEFKKKIILLDTGASLKYISSDVPLINAKNALIKYWQPKDNFLECPIVIPDYDKNSQEWRDAILFGINNVCEQKKEVDRINEEKRREAQRIYKEERRRICQRHESNTLELAICSIMKPNRGLSKGTIAGALRGTKTNDEKGYKHNDYCGKFNIFSVDEIEDALYDLSEDGILDAHEYKNDYSQWCTSYYFKETYFDFTPLDQREGNEGDIPLYNRIKDLSTREQVDMPEVLSLIDQIMEYPAVFCMKSDEVIEILKKSNNLPALKKLIAMRKKTTKTGTKERKIYIAIEKTLKG